MKFITRKDSMTRKILVILLVALVLIFAITPNYSVKAVEVIEQEDLPDEGEGILGSLLKQVIQMIVALGDIVMSALNHFMLGTEGFTSAMLSPDNPNFHEEGKEAGSWLYVDPNSDVDFEFGEGTIDTADFFSWILGAQFDIPNFLYAPENIFANNIAALDVNFLNPNSFQSVVVKGTDDAEEKAETASKSSAGGVLRQVIADWYSTFRNIAIVGLLSVLVYLGIRILISSTATDKAKYKEALQSWVVALCLVFFIHFIMSALLMITDKFNDLFGSIVDEGITVKAYDSNGDAVAFRTNIIGLVRFNAQSVSMYNTAAYSILYLILVIYTCMFTFIYFKRFLYMAFLTMIAPLVALTYPIDKVGDGKAQAFNMWFKEYSMNLVLQPVHLILYVALVSSAMELVKENLIYAIVAIGFLIPAEKFIKKMFGMDKAETPGGFGSFAAGAATMSGLKQVASMIGGGKGRNRANGKNGSEDNPTAIDKNNNRVRTQDRDFLGSFKNKNDDTVDNNSEQLRLPNSENEDKNRPNISDGEENTPFDERQNMIEDRSIWQDMVDDPNTSDLDRGLAQQEIDSINNEMAEKGYLSPEEQKLLDQRRIWDKIANDPNASDAEKLEAQENIGYINDNMKLLNNKDSGPDLQKETEQQLPKEPEQQLPKPENINKQPKELDGYNTRRAIRGAKKLGKIALKGGKIAAQGLGVAGGAMIGLAAGAATGDLSNAMAYMGAGAVAGRSIGKAVGNMPEKAVDFAKGTKDTIEDKIEEYQYNDDKDRYGVGYAAEQAAIRQNERAEKKFLNNKQEQEKYEEMAGRIKSSTGQDIERDDLMRAAFDYKKAGISDEKQIEAGLTMEAKYGGVNGEKHENMMDIVHMTNSYGKDYILDDKKRNSLQTVIKDKVQGEKNQNEVWDLYTEALDMKEIGKRYAINPIQHTQTNSQQKNSSPQKTTTKPRQVNNNSSGGSTPIQRAPGRPRQDSPKTN